MEKRLEEDWLEDMSHDVGVEAFVQMHVYKTISTNVETPLYVNSTKFTRVSTMLRLMNLKVMGRPIKVSNNCSFC